MVDDKPSNEERSARFIAELVAKYEREQKQNVPLIAFMRKLTARQGTVTPDFDALAKKKTELDRRLLDP